jgi:hypothetical protein
MVRCAATAAGLPVVLVEAAVPLVEAVLPDAAPEESSLPDLAARDAAFVAAPVADGRYSAAITGDPAVLDPPADQTVAAVGSQPFVRHAAGVD